MSAFAYPYRRLRLSRTRHMDEHRFVMQQHLGRALRRDEVVHHINGNKRDNRVENLELMSLAEHARLHGVGRPCPESAKEALRRAFEGKRPSLAPLSDETVRAIREARAAGIKRIDVARMFGVHRATVTDIMKGRRYFYVR